MRKQTIQANKYVFGRGVDGRLYGGFLGQRDKVIKTSRVLEVTMHAILSKNVISWLTHSCEGRMTAIYLRFFFSVASGNTEILRLKRRFLKEKSKNSDYFAKQMARRNTMREVN